MSRFAAELRAISERVSLPQPARARILTEMAGDLEDLYQAYLGRGLSEDEAARQALDHLDLSDETMRELARVHGGWFRRLSDSVAERAGTPWEKALLGVLVLGTIGLSGAVVQAVPMSRAAGPWLVPIMCVAFVTLVIGVWKSYVLFLRGDHRPRRLRKGLGPLLGTTLLQ